MPKNPRQLNDLISGKPFFPWLFAVYPVIAIAASNPGQVPAGALALVAGIALSVSTIVVLGSRRLTHSWTQACMCALAFTVFFFSYGPVHYLVEPAWLLFSERNFLTFDVQIESFDYVLTAIWALGISLAFMAIRRFPARHEATATGFLNLLGTFAIGIVAVKVAMTVYTSEQQHPVAVGRPPLVRANAGVGHPDIYYVILDGYARADTLAEYYSFDNKEFLDGLRTRGFAVNERSYANYYWTFLSLASSLNYDYLPKVLTQINPRSKDRSEVYQAIRDNAASRFLKQRGYQIVHMQSTWGATMINPFADRQIACRSGIFHNEYYRAIAEASWLSALQSRAVADLATCHLSNFDTLAKEGAQHGPKFVFAHFVSPHHPYLFDDKGTVLHNANLSNQFQMQRQLWEDRRRYLNQLKFINRKVIETIDAILAASAEPPIIILQSDHGPQLQRGLETHTKKSVRLANFAAYLLPATHGDLLPANGSPVNQFRHIFNYYFSADLPLLPDRYFYSAYRTPFQLQDVTDLIAQTEAAHAQQAQISHSPETTLMVRKSPSDALNALAR